MVSNSFFGIFAMLMAAATALPSNPPIPGSNGTYIYCGTGSVLENFDEPLCAAVKLPSQYVMEQVTLANGTVEYIKTNTTIAEYKAALTKREANQNTVERRGDPPIRFCTSKVNTYFTADSNAWGVWVAGWKQIGGCFYDTTSGWSNEVYAESSWGSNDGTTLNDNLNGAVAGWFGFHQGDTSGFKAYCSWSNPSSTYGCHSIWAQPYYTWHNGWVSSVT
jgi:hypothetical protein